MHKRLINELSITLTIEPDGPLLIKAGDRGGVDPTRPDMEFVRTWHNGDETVYLPGSSLKGMLRAHCEKIARTVARAETEGEMQTRLSCNPLKSDARAPDGSCGEKFSRSRDKPSPEEAFRRSCFVCQMFGNTELASHVRISDAYPQTKAVAERTNRTEERYGVAIDRVYGSVAVGPFQLEAVTDGAFTATVQIRNFTTAQLGLLGLALRDLRQQRVRMGFAKSRGLGRVRVTIDSATLRYPLGDLLPGLQQDQLAGADRIMHGLDAGAAAAYGYKNSQPIALGESPLHAGDWGDWQADFTGDTALDPIWRQCVDAWKEVVQHGR